jgi:AGCS family alanine or glycine:cation symporter
MMDLINNFFTQFSNYIWNIVSILVIGGGIIFFTYLIESDIFSRLNPIQYFKHAFNVLSGKYDTPDEKGQISHFQALSTALSSTVGIGNIAGVAIAISMGGPGALFWMWVSAIVGMATKFFTCSLGIMFRGYDSANELQGGPMYVIEQGMGKKFKFLSYWFSAAGLIGCLSLLQVNQLTQIISNDIISNDNNVPYIKLIIGIIVAIIVSFVIFGGLKRIADVASKLVPFMVFIYLLCGISIIMINIDSIPSVFSLIFNGAFNESSIYGGVAGIMVIGFQRAAFSNEAGMGTEVMAIGASKTNEPIRSGFVAMLGPFIDTILVCSITGIVILLSNDWSVSTLDGSTLKGAVLTQTAFSNHLGMVGHYILLFSVITFALSTMFGYSYYGCKCASYLFGTGSKIYYRIFYVLTLVAGAVLPLELAVAIVDSMFALMAIPTMISALYLSGHVEKEFRRYFSQLEEKK